MTDTGLLAVLLAGIAGLAAGRAWASALRRGERKDRPGYRETTHYAEGLHYATTGQTDLAISELTKVTRDDPDAVEVLQVLGNLLREKGQVERAIRILELSGAKAKEVLAELSRGDDEDTLVKAAREAVKRGAK